MRTLSFPWTRCLSSESRIKEMEVETSEYNGAATTSVMASPTTVGSVTVSLHPLVILNISEHWTRVRAQEGKVQQGKKTGQRSIC